MFIIGIDPGETGGMAIMPKEAVRETKVFSLQKLGYDGVIDVINDYKRKPFTPKTPWDNQFDVFMELPSLNPWLPGKPCRTCKRPPTRNSQSFFKLGMSIGAWEGLFRALGMSMTKVNPRTWMSFLQCPTKGDKKITRTLAQKLFPTLTKVQKNGTEVSIVTHQVADALLIALYGYFQFKDLRKPTHLDKFLKELDNAQRSTQHSKPVSQPVRSVRPVPVTAGRKFPPRRS
jgi:hypothetical protein